MATGLESSEPAVGKVKSLVRVQLLENLLCLGTKPPALHLQPFSPEVAVLSV